MIDKMMGIECAGCRFLGGVDCFFLLGVVAHLDLI